MSTAYAMEVTRVDTPEQFIYTILSLQRFLRNTADLPLRACIRRSIGKYSYGKWMLEYRGGWCGLFDTWEDAWTVYNHRCDVIGKVY